MLPSLGLEDSTPFSRKPVWKEMHSREQFLLKKYKDDSQLCPGLGQPCRRHLACLLCRIWLSFLFVLVLIYFFPSSSLGHNKRFLQTCTLLKTPEHVISRDLDQITDLLLCFLMQVLLQGLGGLIRRNVESTCFIQGCFLCELVTTESNKPLVSNTVGSPILGSKPLMQW